MECQGVSNMHVPQRIWSCIHTQFDDFTMFKILTPAKAGGKLE
jgi:hypothetical protein